MSSFVSTEPEIGVENLIFRQTKPIREKIQSIDIDAMAQKEGLSRIDIVQAFISKERPRGSVEIKKKHKDCLRNFQFWYQNFFTVNPQTKRIVKTSRHEIRARIKSNPIEYSETTAGFKKTMVSIISRPSEHQAIKNVAIKFLAKAYPK